MRESKLPVSERYQLLSERLECRYADRLDFQLSSTLRYPELSEFEELKSLGRTIVPLIIRELLEEQNGFRVQLLEALLGNEVDLARHGGTHHK